MFCFKITVTVLVHILKKWSNKSLLNDNFPKADVLTHFWIRSRLPLQFQAWSQKSNCNYFDKHRHRQYLFMLVINWRCNSNNKDNKENFHVQVLGMESTSHIDVQNTFLHRWEKDFLWFSSGNFSTVISKCSEL